MPPGGGIRESADYFSAFAFSHFWFATPQLVLQALWQEVWHSPQPPSLALLQRSRVSRVFILFICISPNMLRIATIEIYHKTEGKSKSGGARDPGAWIRAERDRGCVASGRRGSGMQEIRAPGIGGAGDPGTGDRSDFRRNEQKWWGLFV
jgi:hypothetical protein